MKFFPSPAVTYLTHCLVFLCISVVIWLFRQKVHVYLTRVLPRHRDDNEEREKATNPVAIGICAFALTLILGILISLPLYGILPLAAIASVAAPRVLEALRIKKYKASFDAQLPDSLQTIASSLRAGLTLKDALKVAADNCEPVVAGEFALALKEYRFGVPIEKALDNVRSRVRTASANIALGAMVISSKIGGRLPEMLAEITTTIRERERVEGKLKALTAQGRAQAAILCAAPPLMGIGMWWWDQDKMRLLTDNWIGQVLLTVAVVLELLGIVVTARMLRLEI